MVDLPLFPLNTVLFPGTPLHLHIFEERYKQMITYCRKNSSPFGVVLIQHGAEAYGPSAEPYSIGCSAVIAQVQPLSQGRMNLTVVGKERFRILSVSDELPYLVGQVEIEAVKVRDPEAIQLLHKTLRFWIEQYLTLLSKDERLEEALRQLSQDAEKFAYLAAMVLQIPPDEKQIFLEIDQQTDLFHELIFRYRKEIALLKTLLAEKPEVENQVFSQN